MRVRFAPSPTGKLHVGNMRIALLNYLFAKKEGGKFLLRMDDTDVERSTRESEQSILDDLQWMHIQWDEFCRQSERLDRYALALEHLKKIGRVYPCYETKEELSLKRKIQSSSGRPPVYYREALKLSAEEIAAYERENRPVYWRFLLNDQTVIKWNDLIHGEKHIPLNSISDPVLVRPDGSFVYTFASVVDDIELGVTHIIRGDDHITNTAVQLDICQALGGTLPEFAHVPLMCSVDGSELSKRSSSALTMQSMQQEGIEPLAVWNVLATIGTANAPDINCGIEELVENFSLSNRSLATVKFDMEVVRSLSHKIIAHKPFEVVQTDLQQLGLSHVSADFWELIRGNINRIADATTWHEVLFGNITPVPQDKEFVQQMIDTFDPDFSLWITKLTQVSGKKGRALYHPLRLAITGREDGPELKKICQIMPLDILKNRLEENLRAS